MEVDTGIKCTPPNKEGLRNLKGPWEGELRAARLEVGEWGGKRSSSADSEREY